MTDRLRRPCPDAVPTAAADVVVRRLERSDLDAVAEIEAASSANPWSRNLFAGELDLPDEQRTWFVAVEGGGPAGAETIGFGGVMYVAAEGHVMNIAVRPDRRRRGLGERLLRSLVDDAVGRGVDALTLEVRVSNTAARELYRRFGFVPAGVRRRYYGDGEDALVLWASDLNEQGSPR